MPTCACHSFAPPSLGATHRPACTRGQARDEPPREVVIYKPPSIKTRSTARELKLAKHLKASGATMCARCLPPLPFWLPAAYLPAAARAVFFHTTAMAHTFFTLHPATPRDTPQVRRVLVLTLQRPEGCLRCGGGPHAPLRRVRPHHALCAASAAAHSPTDTSPLHSPKESGCGTPAATLLRYPREQSRHVSTRASPGARPTASTLRGSFARAEASKVPLAEPVVGALRGMRATNS